MDRFKKALIDATNWYGVDKAGFDQKDLLPTGAVLAGYLLDATGAKDSGKYVTASVSKLRGDHGRKEAYKFLIDRVHEIDPHECMVDIYCCEGEVDPFNPLLTMECEASSGHGRDLSRSATSDDCDYLWDLFKLLQVPSPLRVFLAITKQEKVEELERHIEKLVVEYASARKAEDEVFSVVFPDKSLDGKRTRIMRWSGGASPQSDFYLSGTPA
jgi:hypothetical protein